MTSSPPTKLVLYVEDSPVNAALIEEYVSHIQGVEIMIAVTGEKGLTLAHERKPDLVLMDINLPGINGVDVMEALRKKGEGFSEIPFIALSADAINEEIERALDAGFDDYLTKPIFFDKLKEVLMQHLHLKA